ncbi:MAG: hypothetical protein J6B01_00265 [Ruminococcus sp.]|nr:hypothetical protein [Ruminococcus sp.]
MKKFFDNVWTKRGISLLSLVYTYGVCYLCYLSLFYDIHIHAKVSLCLITIAISIFAIVIMLYTRKQLVTKISSFIILPAMLPVVLLYFGEWGLILPIIFTGVAILLLSGAGEGLKTALGTVTLLLYIFGALGYFIFTSFFVTPVEENVVMKGVSPSGKYRYRVVNTTDSSKGSTAIYIEPNYADLKYPYMTFTLKNMERQIHVERPVNETIVIDWITQSRVETTEQLNQISDNILISLSEENLKKLGYTYDEKLVLGECAVSYRKKIGQTASDVDAVILDTLTDEQLEIFGIGREPEGRYYVLNPSEKLIKKLDAKKGSRIYFSDFNADAYEVFNDEQLDAYGNKLFTVEKETTVPLNSLTDAQLETVGIPAEGDVMLFNGKICFREYVAIAEQYFDVDSRKISLDILN